VLVRLPGGDDTNRAALAAIQRGGTCWLGDMTWQSQCVLRISIVNWATPDDDIDRSSEVIAYVAQTISSQTTC
jgi:hypothetical protein